MTAGSPALDSAEGWIVDASTFGARLALVRHRMRWNVEQAGRECGLPVETWRSWERDSRLPHRLVTIAMAIAARTGCDIDWLVYGPTGKAPRTPASHTSLSYIAERVVDRKTDGAPTQRRPHRSNHTTDPTRPVSQTRPRVADPRRPLIAGRM